MAIVHQESDSERLDRLTVTIKSSLNSQKIVQDFSCSECGEYFGTSDEQRYHIDKYHGGNGVVDKHSKQDKEKIDYVCELCDKVFESRVLWSNHKLLQHTVKAEKMKCLYCDDICDGLKAMCKHIGSKHSELFPERPDRGNQCPMCYFKFNTGEQVKKHMDESHSPDSFYEKLVEEISGVCSKCNKNVYPGVMEDHIKTDHNQADIPTVIPTINDSVKTKIKVTDNAKVVKGSTNTKCNLCAYISISERSLDLHLKRVHAKMFECDECDKRFKEEAGLHHHKTSSHKSSFECEDCDFKAKNLKSQSSHSKLSHRTK